MDMKENMGKTIINVVINGSSYLSDEYTIVVVVQNPAQLGLLLPTAIDIAKLHHGRVILLNMIEIPYQLPPSAARKFIKEQEPF